MTAQPDNTSDGDLLVEANKLMKIADQSEGMVGVSPAFVIALKNLIAQEAKAFAGCRNCYGKGYATVRKGTTAKGKTWDLRTHINYCSCDRGKQLQQVVAQEANKARLQTAIDFATRLKLEFTKRDLSSDNMPKGYRKLTNEELITKVWGELTAEKGSKE